MNIYFVEHLWLPLSYKSDGNALRISDNYTIFLQVKDMQSNIRHLENQVISLMETKNNQEKAIKEYSAKLTGNEQIIHTLEKELTKAQERIQHSEQVSFN